MLMPPAERLCSVHPLKVVRLAQYGRIEFDIPSSFIGLNLSTLSVGLHGTRLSCTLQCRYYFLFPALKRMPRLTIIIRLNVYTNH